MQDGVVGAVMVLLAAILRAVHFSLLYVFPKGGWVVDAVGGWWVLVSTKFLFLL